jgi:DedD protein
MQKDSAADIELNLKKKARRRLVGAIALVILMMLLLPMLLEDRSSTVSHDDIKISIQNENAPVLETTPSTSLGEFDSSVVSADDNTVSISPPVTLSETSQTPEAQKPLIEEDAEAAPMVQAPPPKVSKPSVAPKANASKEQYFVQIGVFSDMNNVKQLQAKLTTLGYKSSTEKITTPKGEKIRLRSQVFTSRNEAAIALQNIKASGLTGMVVSQ